MSERNIVIATALVIVCLFIYGFDFSSRYWQQISIVIAGFLFGNLTTVADYARGNNDV
jgi:hypothetical protein